MISWDIITNGNIILKQHGGPCKKNGDATKKSPAIEMLVVCRPKLLWHMFCQLSYHKKTSVAIFQRLCPSCSRSHLGGHRETTTRTNTCIAPHPNVPSWASGRNWNFQKTMNRQPRWHHWLKVLKVSTCSACHISDMRSLGFERPTGELLMKWFEIIAWLRIKGSRLYLYQWSPDPKNLLRG